MRYHTEMHRHIRFTKAAGWLLALFGTTNLLSAENPLSLNLGAGVSIIDSITYYNLYSRPTFTSDAFGTELYLNLLLSQEGQIRKQDLNWKNIVQDVRLGNPGENFYSKFGNISGHTSGFLGMIVSGYGNQYDENNRLSGLYMNMGKKSWPLEIYGVSGDYSFKSLVSAEATLYLPLLFKREEGKQQEAVPVLGLSYAADHNSDAQDTIKSPYDITEAYGAHLAQPFIAEHSTFILLVEGAKMPRHGQGYIGAVLYNYKITGTETFYYEGYDEYGEYQYGTYEEPVTIVSVDAAAAMVRLSKGFEMGFFDQFYERDKRLYGKMGLTKAQALDSLYPEDRYGTYVTAGLGIKNFSLSGSYFSDKDYGVDVALSSSFFIARSEGLPHFYAEASLNKIRMPFDDIPDKVFALDDRALASASVFYGINRFTGIILSFQWTYVYDSTSGGFVTQQRITPSIYMEQEF